MRTRTQLIRSNLKHARAAWGHIPSLTLQALDELTRKYHLSLASGRYPARLMRRWYVTHAGLLHWLNADLSGIRVRPVHE